MIFEDIPQHNITSAVIYCRVSSKAQTKRGDGLNSQETRCRQYAQYKGYNIKQVFTDDMTGTRGDRPGLRAVLSYLKSNKDNPHVVIIDDLSRFAKRVPVHFEFREAITKAGGVLESPSIILRDDADGEMHEYIIATVNQHQSRKNAEQTVTRMRSRLSNGYWCLSAPIGYKHAKVKGHNGKLLVRNEPLASIVQEGLEGFASGRFGSQVEVKRFFESHSEFPKDLPNGQIRHQRVKDILIRPVYAGMVGHDAWFVPMKKGKHEPLISLQVHDKILKRLKVKRQAPARKDIQKEFPLRGFVLCGDCQKPLTSCWSKGGTGKKHPYYLCFNRDCKSNRKSIPRDKLESEFSELLRKLQPSKKLFDITQSMFRKAWDTRLSQTSLLKLTIKKQLASIEKQTEQLVDRVVECESLLTVTAYEKRIEKLEREKQILAEKLTHKVDPQHSFEEMFERALKFLASPCNLWNSNRFEDKRTVLKLAFSERLPYCRKNGFRTPQVSVPFEFFGFFDSKCEMARRGRFELPTP